MISGTTFTPSLPNWHAASKRARACISVISGYVIPRRTPRWPSIGLNSWSCSTRCRSCRFSRDDVGKFLKIYTDRKILDRDPFASIDTVGVGGLVAMGVERGRKTRPDLKLGICGEHGGDPASIHFFHKVGLDYVSASPYRIPVARLAAAQAALSVKVGD